MAVGMVSLFVLAVIVLAVVLAVTGAVGKRHGRDAAMHCPECRATVSPLDRFCPSCGQPLKPQEIERLDPHAR
jgi:predicted amidophosphoribosyltransferase